LREAKASGHRLLHKPVSAMDLFAAMRELVHGAKD